MRIDSKLAAFGRAAYYSLAVVECWLLGGAGVIGLMVGSGLPFFPEGRGEPNLSDIGVALLLLTLAIPGAIGFLVMIKPDFPRRAVVVWVSGILMVSVAVFCLTALANGWHL
jgi:hypothetical protein